MARAPPCRIVGKRLLEIISFRCIKQQICRVVSSVNVYLAVNRADAAEYCQFDAFNVTCPPGQVIVIDDAQYGRLRIGRCVSRDYGFLGCTADVIDVLDRTCSGRRRCKLPVPHIRQLVQPCPKDLTSYLEASYHCQTGVTPFCCI